MFELLKQVALDNGWTFIYGRKDYTNLFSSTNPGEQIMVVEPVRETPTFDPYGGLESTNYSGVFYLLTASLMDESYDYKYQTYIKPAKPLVLAIAEQLGCEYEITSISTTEVINVLDENMDGLHISYSITK